MFPIVNPVGSAPIFLALTANHTERVRHNRRAGSRSTGVLLLVSLFVGSQLRSSFGITIPVLRVAGGLAVASLVGGCCGRSSADQHGRQCRAGRTGQRVLSADDASDVGRDGSAVAMASGRSGRNRLRAPVA